MRQARFVPLALCDVAQRHDAELPIPQNQQPAAELGHDARAILAQADGFVGLLAAAADVLQHRVARLRCRQLQDGLADQLFLAVIAEHGAERLVRFQDPALVVQGDALERGVGQPARALLALAERPVAILRRGALVRDGRCGAGKRALIGPDSEPFEPLQEDSRFGGREDERVRSRRVSEILVLRGGGGCAVDDDRDGCELGVGFPRVQQLATVLRRQAQIDDGEVRWDLAGEGQSLLAVSCFGGLPTAPLQKSAQLLPVLWFVADDERALHGPPGRAATQRCRDFATRRRANSRSVR